MLVFLLAATFILEIPLSGEPDPHAASELEIQGALSPSSLGVGPQRHEQGIRLERVDSTTLRLTLDSESEVSLGDLERVLGVPVDRSRLRLDRRTVFQIDAGQCFFCAEGPLAQRLAARAFVRSWSVVDYVAKGRLRFRIDPKDPVALEALGLPVDDVIVTARYDGVERVDLYWPTGGILWRPSERQAREEALESKKPLLIFPTAGT